jgi:hypothetical protein
MADMDGVEGAAARLRAKLQEIVGGQDPRDTYDGLVKLGVVSAAGRSVLDVELARQPEREV